MKASNFFSVMEEFSTAARAAWDVLRKECYALFQGLLRFRPFVYGRRVRFIVDSKVLMYMFRSESAVIKRWHAFIQTLDYEMVHVSSESNAIADCISRYTYIAPPAASSTPLLLQRAPQSTPPISRQHDRTSAVRPPSVNSLAPIDHVPAPPLTRSGDVETNPGPSDDAPVILIEDSSSTALATRHWSDSGAAQRRSLRGRADAKTPAHLPPEHHAAATATCVLSTC